MCTAISFKTKDHYFGRTLDLDTGYGEKLVITPRNYPFLFREKGRVDSHFAIIGMAAVFENYPLYFEATNEKGLSVAGLNFPENACYHEFQADKDNISPFEFIPWILGSCKTVSDSEALLGKMNFLKEPFREDLPLTPLHWMISDKERSITVESVASGIKIYENPVGVLTNNPCFDQQLFSLNQYLNLTNEIPQNRFSEKLSLAPYSHGFGAIGLPGDLSSGSRFVRAVFTKFNSVCGESEEESVSQFFHILGTVAQTRGCARMENGEFDISLYTSCCNTDKGIYYYKTYENQSLQAVCLMHENLDGEALIAFPLKDKLQVYYQNENGKENYL